MNFGPRCPWWRNGPISITPASRPLPLPTADVLIEFARDNAANGVADWNRWRSTVETARQLGARLLGAETDEIAVVHNTTEGINAVAEGFPWRPGDNVVTLASEFPSNLYPWVNLADRGVETRQVPVENERVDARAVERACDAKTRVLAVSWVGYMTGWRNDLAELAEIARRRGAFFFVDVIQGLGMFPLDVRKIPVDALAADGHKWLLGPEGAGLFYLRKEHFGRLRPIGVGWNSVRHSGDFTNTSYDLKTDASRYEGGSHCLAAIAGFARSLRMIVDVGSENISQRLLDVTDRMCERLGRRGLPRRQLPRGRAPLGNRGFRRARPQSAGSQKSVQGPRRDPQRAGRPHASESARLLQRGRHRIEPGSAQALGDATKLRFHRHFVPRIAAHGLNVR